MTGTELSAALAEKLKVLLPDCAVRPAFTGTLQRLPQRAAVTVGVMQEENVDGVFETVLGVQLYARERDDHARLFDAVCAAVSSLPCALRSVKRSETTYSAALSCLVTLCTVQAATGAEFYLPKENSNTSCPMRSCCLRYWSTLKAFELWDANE